MTPFPVAAGAAAAVAFVLHFIMPAGRQLSPRKSDDWETHPVGLTLFVALALTTGVLSFFVESLPRPEALPLGRPLWPLLLAAAPLCLCALVSDFGRPNSERHALGLLASGFALFAFGFAISFVSHPVASGTFDLHQPVTQVLLTVLWLGLVASIIELTSLVPYAMAIAGVALSSLVWIMGGGQQTAGSYALAGIVAGSLIGREVANAVSRRKLPYGKSEVFALGIWLTALSNVALFKSLAFAAFVLPLGALTIAAILVGVRAFERSLLLRGAPRGD